ncbi:MAG: hypothetical protein ACXWH7_02045 [Thermoanaerobaculia bacterium]
MKIEKDAASPLSASVLSLFFQFSIFNFQFSRKRDARDQPIPAGARENAEGDPSDLMPSVPTESVPTRLRGTKSQRPDGKVRKHGERDERARHTADLPRLRD